VVVVQRKHVEGLSIINIYFLKHVEGFNIIKQIIFIFFKENVRLINIFYKIYIYYKLM
jgi:hypothetical protein